MVAEWKDGTHNTLRLCQAGLRERRTTVGLSKHLIKLLLCIGLGFCDMILHSPSCLQTHDIAKDNLGFLVFSQVLRL